MYMYKHIYVANIKQKIYETAIEQRENWKELAEGRGQQK